MHDITASQVQTGGQHGISWEGGDYRGRGSARLRSDMNLKRRRSVDSIPSERLLVATDSARHARPAHAAHLAT
jgi:hypothetical protein